MLCEATKNKMMAATATTVPVRWQPPNTRFRIQPQPQMKRLMTVKAFGNGGGGGWVWLCGGWWWFYVVNLDCSMARPWGTEN